MGFVLVKTALNEISLASVPVILHIYSSVIRKTAFLLRLSLTSLFTHHPSAVYMGFVSVKMTLNDISLVSFPVIVHIYSSVIRKTAFLLRLSLTSLLTLHPSAVYMGFVWVKMTLNEISLVSVPVIVHIYSSVIRKTAFLLRLSLTSLVTLHPSAVCMGQNDTKRNFPCQRSSNSPYLFICHPEDRISTQAFSNLTRHVQVNCVEQVENKSSMTDLFERSEETSSSIKASNYLSCE